MDENEEGAVPLNRVRLGTTPVKAVQPLASDHPAMDADGDFGDVGANFFNVISKNE